MRYSVWFRYFYYNTVTAVSQWERPTTSASSPATKDKQPAALGHFHQDHHPDAEGSIEDGYVAPRDGDDKTAQAGNYAVTLPIDWKVAADDLGNEYFFNVVTGESRWAPPTDDIDGADKCRVGHSSVNGSGDSNRADGTMEETPRHSPPQLARQSIGGPDGPNVPVAFEKERGSDVCGDLVITSEVEPAGLAPLSAGWEVVTPEDGGSCYYHQISTGVTQWEPPTQGSGDVWEEFATDEGVPYWNNPVMGESRWLPP